MKEKTKSPSHIHLECCRASCPEQGQEREVPGVWWGPPGALQMTECQELWVGWLSIEEKE